MVLPLSADELEVRWPHAFCLAALVVRPLVTVVERERFEDAEPSDSRLEEGVLRRMRVLMKGCPLPLTLVLGSECLFEVEERLCWPFSRAVWRSKACNAEVEVLTMVVDEDRGRLEKALGETAHSVDFVDLGEAEPIECMFDDKSIRMPDYDVDSCDPCCCVYVLAKASLSVSMLQGQMETRLVDWLVREPLIALCRRVVGGMAEPVTQTDVEVLERKLAEPISVSSPVRIKKTDTETLDPELAAAIRRSSLREESPSLSPRSVSAPTNVKRLEDLSRLDAELVAEIRRVSPRVSQILPAYDVAPNPVATTLLSPRSSAAFNLASLPAPPILPEQVRATSPRSSQVLPGPPPASVALPLPTSLPLAATVAPPPAQMPSPRSRNAESPRVAIPLCRKSTGDIRSPGTSPRGAAPRSRPLPNAPAAASASSPSAVSAPPPPPPPPPPMSQSSSLPVSPRSPRATAATLPAGSLLPQLGSSTSAPPRAPAPPVANVVVSTSPRMRSSTVLEEDLVAQAQRLRASPPTSPRQPPKEDVFDVLFKRIESVRSAVHREEDDDEDWDE